MVDAVPRELEWRKEGREKRDALRGEGRGCTVHHTLCCCISTIMEAGDWGFARVGRCWL